MSCKPKVSVCIPTFNRSTLLFECIASVREQTFRDFELVVVDNASMDDTEAVVRGIDDPRVRYARNEQNIGMTRNWNRCLELAQGECICVFSDDDLMMPSNLEEKVRALDENPDVGMVGSPALPIDERGRTLKVPTEVLGPARWLLDQPARLLTREVNFYPSAVLFRRCVYDEVGHFDETLEGYPDVDMWFRVALRYPVLCINRRLIKYRGHERSGCRILATAGATEMEHAKLLAKYFNRPDPALASFRRAAYYTLYVRTGGMYMYVGRLAEARRLYVQALRGHPVRFIRERWPFIFLVFSCFGPATFSVARRLWRAIVAIPRMSIWRFRHTRSVDASGSGWPGAS